MAQQNAITPPSPTRIEAEKVLKGLNVGNDFFFPETVQTPKVTRNVAMEIVALIGGDPASVDTLIINQHPGDTAGTDLTFAASTEAIDLPGKGRVSISPSGRENGVETFSFIISASIVKKAQAQIAGIQK